LIYCLLSRDILELFKGFRIRLISLTEFIWFPKCISEGSPAKAIKDMKLPGDKRKGLLTEK